MRVRKHVLSDLQPYICTHPDCQLNDYFFENKDDWFHHESHTHRVEWFCNTASHKSFMDIQEFLDHMHTIHSEPLDKAQLLHLRHGFQRPSDAQSGTCTLCGKHASRLKSHLARHLEQLALFAIPQTDYMAALEEDDISSNAARKGFRAQSILGSSEAASKSSSFEFYPEVEDLKIDLGKFRAGDTPNEQHDEARETLLGDSSFLDVSDDPGEEVDTSWDQITSKFKEARDAMDSDQRAEESEHQKQSSRNRQPLERWTQKVPVLVSPDQTSATPDTPRFGPRDVHEVPTIAFAEPPSPPKVPLSLRERAGRFTSNILSPFRSRKESQPVVPSSPRESILSQLRLRKDSDAVRPSLQRGRVSMEASYEPEGNENKFRPTNGYFGPRANLTTEASFFDPEEDLTGKR
jgi:hypothetical protein